MLSVIIVCCFGLLKTTGWGFLCVYMICYIAYIIVTIIADNNKDSEEVEGEKN